MLIYYFLYGSLIIASYLCFQSNSFKDKNNAKKAFCIVGFILLALYMSLRHPSSGMDIISRDEKIGYYDMFTYISKLPLSKCFTVKITNYENGYIVLNKFLSYISKDPQIIIAFCGILQSACLFTLIYKTSKKPFLSTVIYLALPCFLINLSGLRQSIAISITMIAFLMIKEKKLVKFILLVLFASLFHSSAIIFLIAYPLYHLRQSSMWKLISIVAIPIVYVFRLPLFRVLSAIFKENAEVQDTGAITLFLVFTAMYIFLMVVVNNSNKLATGCTNLFWLACICQAFGGLYDTVLRVTYYFMAYALVAVPEVLADDDRAGAVLNYKYKQLIHMIVLMAFIGYAFYIFYDNVGNYPYQWFKTNPYVFFWQTP